MQARCALSLGAMRLPGRGSKMLTFVWLVRFSSNLDHRLVMVWDKMVVVHAKARNNRNVNAASIQVNTFEETRPDKPCGLRAMSPMRPSGYDSGAAFGLCLRCSLRAMIWCGLRAMTPHDTDRGQDRVRDFEVGLIDAVSSSLALKETWCVFVLKVGCYKLVSEP
ncbi:hypothetical protein L2E82_01123 [Cichorium intybus]|uniref:Uncharacterized protein n=1 Tax=Cichorium intybus TaxID=13427 RepID=A0ACB9GYQ8_CICIN|nr:hypothetical protein L2E82_01123 [Cichorium intybus]